MKNQSELQVIIELMSRWLAQVRLNTALTFYDINKISEDFACKLLNLIFNYELVNLNLKQANFPGIDLGDKTKGMVAFQVTSRIDGEKIRETLRMFVERKYNYIFVNGIKFFILNQNTVKFGNQNPEYIYSKFDKQKDILTDKDIIQEIQEIYNNNPDKFKAIKQLFSFEFGDVTGAVNSSTSESRFEPDVFDKQKELVDTVSIIRETIETKYTIHQRDTLSPSIHKAMNEEANKGFSLPQGSLAGRLFDIYIKEISVYSSIIRECSLSFTNNSSIRFSSPALIGLFKELLIAHNKEIKNFHNRQVTDLFTHGSSPLVETMVDHFSKQADIETKLRCKELFDSLKINKLSTCAEMDFQPWEPIIKENPILHTFSPEENNHNASNRIAKTSRAKDDAIEFIKNIPLFQHSSGNLQKHIDQIGDYRTSKLREFLKETGLLTIRHTLGGRAILIIQPRLSNFSKDDIELFTNDVLDGQYDHLL